MMMNNDGRPGFPFFKSSDYGPEQQLTLGETIELAWENCMKALRGVSKVSSSIAIPGVIVKCGDKYVDNKKVNKGTQTYQQQRF
jgi:hypothetical protein